MTGAVSPTVLAAPSTVAMGMGAIAFADPRQLHHLAIDARGAIQRCGR